MPDIYIIKESVGAYIIAMSDQAQYIALGRTNTRSETKSN